MDFKSLGMILGRLELFAILVSVSTFILEKLIMIEALKNNPSRKLFLSTLTKECLEYYC